MSDTMPRGPLRITQDSTRSVIKLIDRIRHDIQQRLDQLLTEAEKLRRALAALGPRGRSAPQTESTKSPTSAKPRATRPRATKPSSARTPARAKSTRNEVSASPRTAPGETKAKVLAALLPDRGLTAGEVAQATGLARPTVSTTLSKLAKTGHVAKADRGYRLPTSDDAAAAPVTDR
jgi:DNA-binding transcriptional ArsR family regulator